MDSNNESKNGKDPPPQQNHEESTQVSISILTDLHIQSTEVRVSALQRNRINVYSDTQQLLSNSYTYACNPRFLPFNPHIVGLRVTAQMCRSSRWSKHWEMIRLLFAEQVGEIAEMPDYENLSTSAVLHYCKHKILMPYLRLLAVMGLKPTNSDDSRCCILANLHTFQVAVFMCIGYILQYMACFR